MINMNPKSSLKELNIIDILIALVMIPFHGLLMTERGRFHHSPLIALARVPHVGYWHISDVKLEGLRALCHYHANNLHVTRE